MGRIKSHRSEKYLKGLYLETADPETASGVLYALSYKPDKQKISFLIRQLENIKAKENPAYQRNIDIMLPALLNENKETLEELKNSPNTNGLVMYLRGKALTRDRTNLEELKGFLSNENPRVREETVKTLHLLLSFQEKKELFNNLRKIEKDGSVLWQIEQSIGL